MSTSAAGTAYSRSAPSRADTVKQITGGVTRAGEVPMHRQLLTEIWGARSVDQTHYLRVHIAHLRDKLEMNPSAPDSILNEPTAGYRLLVKAD